MAGTKHSFDNKCHGLAMHFAEGLDGVTPTQIANLAQCIQDAVENWIAECGPFDELPDCVWRDAETPFAKNY